LTNLFFAITLHKPNRIGTKSTMAIIINPLIP
jgi:hypothetical protein